MSGYLNIPGHRLILWIILFSGVIIFQAQAETNHPSLTIHPEQQYKFAETYFSAKDYTRAAGEFQRFIYFFSDDSRVDQARYFIGLSFYRSADYIRAIDTFNQIIDTGKDASLISKSYIMIKNCYEKQNDSVRAIITLNNMLLTAPDDDTRNRARYELGWLYVELGRWDEATSVFEKISPANGRRYQLKRLIKSLTSVPEIPRKNPTAAGLLAIIPGAGYAYCERPRDAMISFFVNAGLIYTAIEAFDHENIGMGSLLALVELGFYSGNIYGSINSAHKFNKTRIRMFINHLKKNIKIKLSSVSRATGISLSLQYRF